MDAAQRDSVVSLVAAGRTVDVRLVDHLVVGDQGRFVSIRRNHPECFR